MDVLELADTFGNLVDDIRIDILVLAMLEAPQPFLHTCFSEDIFDLCFNRVRDLLIQHQFDLYNISRDIYPYLSVSNKEINDKEIKMSD